MKKIAMILALGLVSVSLAISQETKTEKKEELRPSQETGVVKTLQLAFDLAKYGYENDSPVALLQAAEIYATVSTQKADKGTKEGEETTAEEKNAQKEPFTAEKLIADAKKMAGKDKTVAALAKDVERKAKKSTRGAVGGAKYDYDWLYGGNTCTYTVNFVAGTYCEVGVNSVSGYDFDIFLYDQWGNLCFSENSYAPSGYIWFYPNYTGPYKVVIKNGSSYRANYEFYSN